MRPGQLDGLCDLLAELATQGSSTIDVADSAATFTKLTTATPLQVRSISPTPSPSTRHAPDTGQTASTERPSRDRQTAIAGTSV
jgi:hypothetical protein